MVARRWTSSLLVLLVLFAVLVPVPGVALARQTAPTGNIAVRLHACPEQMRPLDFDAAACPLDADVADLQIFVIGSGANRRATADAMREGDALVWDDLPFGEYVVQPKQLAAGYDRYLIPGQSGLNISPDLGYSVGPNEGYLLPLDAAHPTYTIDLYVFHAYESAGALRLGVRFWQCPDGVAAAPDMRGLGCAVLPAPPPGFDIEVAGAEIARPLSLAQAIAEAGDRWSWGDVPGGEYRVTARLLADSPGYAVRAYDPGVRVKLLSDHSGYALAFLLAPGALPAPTQATLDVYLLR